MTREDVSDESTSDASHEIPTHQAQVQLVLGASFGDPNGFQDFGEVIRDESVP